MSNNNEMISAMVSEGMPNHVVAGYIAKEADNSVSLQTMIAHAMDAKQDHHTIHTLVAVMRGANLSATELVDAMMEAEQTSVQEGGK